MASNGLISLDQAAALLDVHYMTAYRYVRTGRMPAVKEGGRWWVEVADIDRMCIDANAHMSSSPVSTELPADAFRVRLLAGDTGGCWNIITSLLNRGVAPTDIHNGLVQPALERIGRLWATGEVSIAHEHRATCSAQRVLGQLGPNFRHPGRRRGTIIIGAVAGDYHLLPSAILGDLLRDRRFEVEDLGANNPTISFIDAAEGCDDLVGIGVCAVIDSALDSASEQLIELRAELPSVKLVAGGPALANQAQRFRPLADHVTVDAVSACEAFEGE